jgi:hypothetical protein
MTFYVSSGNSTLPNYDSIWADAATSGFELGNRSAHHRLANGTGCSFGSWAGSQAAELDSCSSYITSHYAQSSVWKGASPFGDTGWDSAAAARFFVFRGVASGTIAPNDNTDPFNLPCQLAAQAETAGSFNAATHSTRSAGKWLIYLFHSINPTSSAWYDPVAITELTCASASAAAP